MVFKDVNDKLYVQLAEEYRNSVYFHNGGGWSEFVSHKQLGIAHCANYSMHESICSTYAIVDEHKWCMTKLKYDI